MSETKTRIYLVEDMTGLSHLVEAVTKAAAINFIARRGINAKVASQMELVALIASGEKVVKASSEVVSLVDDEEDVA